MKLIQITHNDAGKHYVYKCEVCGATLTADTEVLKCPACRIWAEDVAEEMEETNEND